MTMRARLKFLVLDALVVCVIAGSWLIFTGQVSKHELMLGAGCVVLSVCIDSMAWRGLRIHFFPNIGEMAVIWRLPWYVMSGIWEMFVILMNESMGKRAGSFYRATPFHAAGGVKGISQIILATAYTTVAPNFIVIGISDGKLLFHQLERSSVPRMITDLERQG
jgi:hypothetical protein